MARPSRPWFRFYVEAIHDPKVLRLTPPQRWIWVAVLAAARQSTEPGTLTVSGGEPMTERELARWAGADSRLIRRAIGTMLAEKMLDREGTNGALRVVNWDARQYESDVSTERTRAFRDRSRNVPNDGEGTFPKRSNGNFRNGPETEAETESYREVLSHSHNEHEPALPEETEKLGHWVYLAYGGRVERSECDALVRYGQTQHVEPIRFREIVKASTWPSDARNALRTPTQRGTYTYDADADHEATDEHAAELIDPEKQARIDAMLSAMRQPKGDT
jgi:hypothetical protein